MSNGQPELKRRVSDRVDLNRSVQLKFGKFQDFLTEIAGNISPSGMFVHSDSPEEAGEEFEFECSLADGFPLVSGRAEVVWVRQASSADQPSGMGVRFLELNDNSEDLIRRIVNERIKAGEKTFDLEMEGAKIEPPSEEAEPEIDVSDEILAATDRLVDESAGFTLTEESEDPVDAILDAAFVDESKPPPAQPDVKAEPVESLEPAELLDESQAQSELTTSTTAAAAVAPAEFSEPVEPPKPAEPAEPAEPVESLEFVELSEPVEPVEPPKPVEPPEKIAKPPKPAVPASPPPPASPVPEEEPPETREPKPTAPLPVRLPDALREQAPPSVPVAQVPDPALRVGRARPPRRLSFGRFVELLVFSLLAGLCMVLLFNQFWVRPRIDSLEARLEELTGSSRVGGPPGIPRAESPAAQGGTEEPGTETEDADAATAAPAPTATMPAEVALEVRTRESAEDVVKTWAEAWSKGRVDDYLSFYSTNFAPASGVTRVDWEERRRERLANSGSIRVAVVSMNVEEVSPTEVRVTFTQSYQSETFRDRVRKTLRMILENGEWRIVEELVVRQLPW